MKRAAMLYCAGTDATRYKVLGHRGQLPFPENDNPLGNDFTLDHAFRLRLALDLIGGEDDSAAQLGGLGPSYAAKIVAESIPLFPRHPLNQFEPGDWCIGVVIFEKRVGEDQERLREPALYVGELQALQAWADAKGKQHVDEHGYQLWHKVVRVFLANVTRAADYVRDRAGELGLPDWHVSANASQVQREVSANGGGTE